MQISPGADEVSDDTWIKRAASFERKQAGDTNVRNEENISDARKCHTIESEEKTWRDTARCFGY